MFQPGGEIILPPSDISGEVDAEGLAAAISECLLTKLDEDGRGENLIRDYDAARCEFALRYEAIVNEVLGDRPRRKPLQAVSEDAEAGAE